MNAAPESPKLEACPFCLNPPEKLTDAVDGVRCVTRECPLFWFRFPRSEWNRRPAPTASPAPEGVTGDVARSLTFAERFGHSNGNEDDSFFHLQTLTSHVQSQSSTMAGLREEVERLREAVAYIASQEDKAGNWAVEICRAALKSVEKGDKDEIFLENLNKNDPAAPTDSTYRRPRRGH